MEGQRVRVLEEVQPLVPCHIQRVREKASVCVRERARERERQRERDREREWGERERTLLDKALRNAVEVQHLDLGFGV